MAMGMLEELRQCKGLLSVLILILSVTSWNRSVNGDNGIRIGGLPQLVIPPIPGIPKFGNILPPKIEKPSCSFEDVTALLNFRAQLLDPRDALSSWNPVTDCCTWRGITCSSSSDQRRVTGLQLSIQGHESDTSFLSVSSYFNGVAGVPLSSLSALETLSLTSVAFNTDLPSAWGTLVNLNSLSLVNCALTGGIPPTYVQLRKLRHVCLNNNKLAGQLPPYMTEVFRQLRTLDLSSNSFTGSIELLFRSNLTSLDLAHNDFDDNPLPDLFLFLPNLRHLDLSHNRIDGSIPQSLQLLLDLRFLDLSTNRFHGAIPSALFAIKTLTSVFLQDNYLSGSIPAVFALKSHIEELDLSNNSLSGIIPPTISVLGQLQSLDLSHNNLSGGIPATLVFNSELEFLFLESNGLVGFIPPELASLKNLVLANVSHNLLIGPVPGGPWPSFPASSFEGDLGLCGSPLKHCFLTI